MYKKIEKGTDKWNFFQEFFKFIQDYSVPENTDAFWSEVSASAKELTDKYENTDFIISARGMVLSHLEELECKSGLKRTPREIKFTVKGGNQ